MVGHRYVDVEHRSGRKGGGPRTAAGKRRSSQNARKHGLSLSVLVDPKLNAEALRLARVIAGKGADDDMLVQAWIVAESELTLQRIYHARIIAIETANRTGAVGGRDSGAKTSDAETSGAFLKALPVLSSMDRYERRALSCQKKAWQHLNDLKAIAQFKQL